MSTKDKKLNQAIQDLNQAMLSAAQAHKNVVIYAGISKLFETCLEYAWKYFKQQALDEGLEVFSPKDAIKMAGRMDLIDSVEDWLGFLEGRNLAVHDYQGVSQDDYLNTIRKFLSAVKKIK